MKLLPRTRPACYELPSQALAEAWWRLHWQKTWKVEGAPRDGVTEKEDAR